MGESVEIKVYGVPAPQGSKDAIPVYKGRGPDRRFTGKVVQRESSSAVAPWREAVRQEAVTEMAVAALEPFTGAVEVIVVFTLPKGKSVRRSLPAVRPDLDKLLRSTLDALKDAGVYGDDGQVCRIVTDKFYPGGLYALDRPGATIKVRELGS